MSLPRRPRFEDGERVEIVDSKLVYHVDGRLIGSDSAWRYQGARGRVVGGEERDAAILVSGRIEVLLDEVVLTDPQFDRGAPSDGVRRVLVRPIALRHVDVVESIAELDEQGPA